MTEFRFTNEHTPSSVGAVCDVLRRPRLWIPTVRDYPGHSAWVEKTEAEIMSGHKHAMLAYIGREPVGTVIYRQDDTDPHTLAIRNLSISPEVAGRYFGSFLLRNSELEAVTRDYPNTKQIVVDTKTTNSGMINFLTVHGYESNHITDLYGQGTGQDLVLVKTIA